MKMKKILAVACACLIGLTAVGIAEVSDVISDDFAAITANAEDLTSGDWKYSVNKDGTVTIEGYIGSSDTIKIPSAIDGKTVTTIGDYAFYRDDKVHSVTIPDTVTDIGYVAFYESALKSVTVPSSVKSCDRMAFYNCDQLTTVVFGAEKIPINAFSDCDKLKTVTSSAIYIEDGAFDGCESLTTFTNKNDVLEIGYCAFKNCTSLSSFNIGSKVTTIESQAFYKTALKSVTIPSTAKSCDSHIFYDCDQLTTVVFKAEEIPSQAFDDCDNLKTVTSSAKYIDSSAFISCGKLSSFTNKNDILKIGDSAFENCTSLTSFDMGDKVTHLDSDVFKNSGVKSLTIPSTVKDWGGHFWGENEALYNCKNLKTVYFGYNTMPEDITDSEGITFYCYPGSDALQYAKDNKISYKLRTAVASTSIKLSKTSLTMEVGKEYYLDATMASSNTTDDITWKSDDEDIATVNSAGVVTAKKAGSVSIKATTRSGKTATCNITVKKPCDGAYNSGTTTKAATCTDTGRKEYTCTCGAVYNDLTDKLGHSYKNTVVAPTYAAQGYTKHTCTRCGYVYKDNYKAKKTVKTVSAKTTYTCTSSAIRINWNKLSGVSGYRLYRYDSAKKTWVGFANIYDPNATNYKVSGLSAGTVYKFKVKAFVKENGKTYFGTASSTITTATKPKTTTITKSNKVATAVRLYWNKLTCTGYRIDRYDSAQKKWVKVKAVGSSSTTQYRISGLKKNTTYKFRIVPYVKVGTKYIYGAASKTYTVKTTK